MTFAIGGMSFWAAYLRAERTSRSGAGEHDLWRHHSGRRSHRHRAWGLARRLVGEAFHRLLPGLWLRHVTGVSVQLAMLYTPFPLAWLFCFLAVFFLQYWPGEYRDCQRDETRGSGHCICGGNFHHARFGRCHLASADWSCRRSVESQYRFSGGLFSDADSRPALAGGCEISRPRCSESCAPIENFVGCASILGMLICFVCS
jgi:hypothetical protein